MPRISYVSGEVKPFGDSTKPLVVSANKNFMYGFAENDIIHTYWHNAKNSDLLCIPAGYGILWIKASMAVNINISVGV